MASDVIAPTRLRHWWFSHLRDLSDLEMQRRTWLDVTNTNPHWSYVEFVESYPRADQLADAFKRGWLNVDELAILSELGRLLESHAAPGGDDFDNQAVLDDPAWQAVVEAAKRATQRLLSMSTDPREREILLGAA